jgi:hypothetical protein
MDSDKKSQRCAVDQYPASQVKSDSIRTLNHARMDPIPTTRRSRPSRRLSHFSLTLILRVGDLLKPSSFAGK